MQNKKVRFDDAALARERGRKGVQRRGLCRSLEEISEARSAYGRARERRLRRPTAGKSR